ncbi:MAG TPA: TylF/MycF/NovP-related O-methyltransferase [Candidatus Acidoferrales bacterium]|nr:TylF/MycF/NovP-related O-methyltransferase [Candidatus Acidoferrales bacterium]
MAIDYLEFGVAEGDSIRRWTDLNTNAGSRFFGFDSFRGLPEDWKLAGRAIPRGSFGTGGRTPLIEGDARVRWIVGLFQETLPAFLQDFHPENQLVIHLDADLYSSTLYVLSALNDILGPGAIVIFDEFASFDNEFRALQDFSSAFRRVYGLLAGAGGCYDKVAIQFGGEPRSSAARIGW